MDTCASGPAMKCGVPDIGLSSLLLHLFFFEAQGRANQTNSEQKIQTFTEESGQSFPKLLLFI